MPHRDRSIGGKAYIFCQKNAMTKPDDAFTVESHFEGKDDSVRQIYDRLLKEAGRFGPVMEEPKKTSIHLVNRTAFAGVATRQHALILTIKSDRKLSSPRIHKSEQTSVKRFHHQVKVNSPAEIDSELVSWLQDAYALSG